MLECEDICYFLGAFARLDVQHRLIFNLFAREVARTCTELCMQNHWRESIDALLCESVRMREKMVNCDERQEETLLDMLSGVEPTFFWEGG
eukprot:1617256-Amphidinium_carterae.2